jgi:VWFA-related protein
MNTKYSLLVFAIMILVAAAAVTIAQTPKPSPTPPPVADDDVVKITTKLVQIDAVVVDKDGTPVSDLKDSDFELLQDGKPQKITHLSYVDTASVRSSQPDAAAKKDKNDIAQPPVRFGGPGRIITFIVDDGNCSASTTGMFAAKAGLQKFVKEQMLPTDHVAIYKTMAGSSVLQQYASDKTQLLRTIDKIRWYPPAGSCSFSNGSIFQAARSNILDKISPDSGMTSSQIESDADRKTRESGEDFSRNNQVVGTLGLINYVVRGLERVGGRKIVFVMSDGLQLRGRNGEVLSSMDTLRDVTELANRASVILNTIDVRGVFSTSMIEAADEVRTQADVNASDKVIDVRDAEVRSSREGLQYLARWTGGKFYHDSNDLDVPVKTALSLEQGYYLLAYEPPDDTFKSKKFNQIEIRVKRADLSVRFRSGFYGNVDQPLATHKRSADSDLYDAIAAPLPTAGLNLQLTAFFGNSADEGNYVRSLIHLPGDEITFIDDAGGFKKAVLDVVAVTLDEKNRVVDEFTRTHIYKVQSEAIPFIRQNGLTYSTDVPIKKAGTYNFRVAVRDDTTKLLGSSSQVVEIPDMKKGKLFLSGLTVSQVDVRGKFVIPGPVKAENAIAMTPTTGSPAMRQFHRGSVAAYSYTIYNAQLDKVTQQPNLSVQMKLFRDGQLMIDGKPETAKLEKQSDWSRIIDYAYLQLDPNVQPGDYTLQLIVKDLVSADKNAVSSQWVDFQILP